MAQTQCLYFQVGKLNKGQARQGFDSCRAVSLYEGHEEKADAGFVDAQGSILTGRILVVFRAKLW